MRGAINRSERDDEGMRRASVLKKHCVDHAAREWNLSALVHSPPFSLSPHQLHAPRSLHEGAKQSQLVATWRGSVLWILQWRVTGDSRATLRMLSRVHSAQRSGANSKDFYLRRVAHVYQAQRPGALRIHKIRDQLWQNTYGGGQSGRVGEPWTYSCEFFFLITSRFLLVIAYWEFKTTSNEED